MEVVWNDDGELEGGAGKKNEKKDREEKEKEKEKKRRVIIGSIYPNILATPKAIWKEKIDCLKREHNFVTKPR